MTSGIVWGILGNHRHTSLALGARNRRKLAKCEGARVIKKMTSSCMIARNGIGKMSGEEMRRRMQRVRRDVSLYLLPVMCPMLMLSGVLVSSVAMP